MLAAAGKVHHSWPLACLSSTLLGDPWGLACSTLSLDGSYPESAQLLGDDLPCRWRTLKIFLGIEPPEQECQVLLWKVVPLP